MPELCTQLPVADFPDAFRANLWVRGLSQDSSANEALADFKVQICPMLDDFGKPMRFSTLLLELHVDAVLSMNFLTILC